jgi:hypothetical protein
MDGQTKIFGSGGRLKYAMPCEKLSNNWTGTREVGIEVREELKMGSRECRKRSPLPLSILWLLPSPGPLAAWQRPATISGLVGRGNIVYQESRWHR